MIHFEPYPIYVNHSHWRQHALRMADEFQRKGDFHMMEFMDKMAMGIMPITPDNPQPQESKDYEAEVVKWLKIIGGTALGRLLFDSLNLKEKIWIVTHDQAMADACQCPAATTPGVLDAKQGGGVRLWYDPRDFDYPDFYISPDGALFHELVHAHRSTRVGIKGQNWKPLREYWTSEEFLAVHMTNVYLSGRSWTKFHRSHSNAELLPKDKVYAYLSSDMEALNALYYYLAHEPLTTQVARWKVPAFNPWRDYAALNAAWLRAHPYDVSAKIRGIIAPAL